MKTNFGTILFVSENFSIPSAFSYEVTFVVEVLLTTEFGHLWRTVSDFFQLDDLLSSEDVALRERIRGVMEKHIAPVMTKVGICRSIVFFDRPLV